MLSLLVTVVLGSLLPPACSVRELRESARTSQGYHWRVERIAEFVDSAHIVVRARATSQDSIDAPTSRGTFRQAVVRFTPIEWLRESVAADSLAFPGQFVDRDDFNSRSVPYQIVR